jgi:hypothetical protein
MDGDHGPVILLNLLLAQRQARNERNVEVFFDHKNHPYLPENNQER